MHQRFSETVTINSNSNSHNNVYGAVIMAMSLREQLTFTGSSAGTRPSAHTATAPMRWSSIWCSSVRPTTTPGGTPGQARRHLHYRPVTPLELPGTDWGGDPPPGPGMRESSPGSSDKCSTSAGQLPTLGPNHRSI